MTLQAQRVQTLEQARAFVEGSEAVDFAVGDRTGVYTLVRRKLVELDRHRLGEPDSGLVKRHLANLPQRAPDVGTHTTDRSGDRRPGPARILAGVHGPSGRTGTGQGGVSHPRRRQAHPVASRRYPCGDLGALPNSGARSADRGISPPNQRFPRRQRLRAHQLSMPIEFSPKVGVRPWEWTVLDC